MVTENKNDQRTSGETQTAILPSGTSIGHPSGMEVNFDLAKYIRDEVDKQIQTISNEIRSNSITPNNERIYIEVVNKDLNI